MTMYCASFHQKFNSSLFTWLYVLFTITIISHHYCSLILTIIPKPVRRFRLPSPPAGKKPYPYSSPDIYPNISSFPYTPLIPPSPIPSSSQPSHKKSESSPIMLLSSIISFSNDAAAIEKTLRGIQGLATIAIGFYQQQPQHTQVQGQIEMWIKLRGELALGMQINHHHHHHHA